MGSALLLPPLLARSAEAASQPTPGFDLWAAATVCLQRYGRLGTAVLVGLVVVGWVLDKTEGVEALLRLLGWGRKPPEPPPVHKSDTHGNNSPLITGGTFSPLGNQFIGGEHTHLSSPSPLASSSTTVEVSGTGNATLTNVVAARDVIVTPTIHHHPQLVTPPKGTPCNLRFRSIGSLFKGRAPLMEQLGAATRPVALIGLGGVGKTRLAIEHAWKEVTRRPAVLLVSADSPEALNRNLAGLCNPSALDLPEQTLTEEAAQRQAVLHWLQAHPGWLLILDSVDTEEVAAAVETLLPQLSGGQLVITTPLGNWSAAVQGLEVAELEPVDAREFLLERTAARRRKTDHDTSTAKAIAVDDLGRLALALEQAGAYISERRLSLEAYRQEWQHNRAAVLRWLDPQLMQYAVSLATTWLTSYLQVESSARTLLRRLAWLSPEPIPESLLEVEVPRDSQAASGARDALLQLEAYSLVAISGEAPFFSLHRLVQEVARLWQEQSEQPEPNELQAALGWVKAAFNGDPQDVRSWPVLEPLEPHAKAVAGFADAQGIAEPTSWLQGQLAVLLRCKAAFSEAEFLYRRALAIDEARYGHDHQSVAIRLNNLAALLRATNRLAEAEPLMARAFSIFWRSLGLDHPNTQTMQGNYISLLQEMGLSEPEIQAKLESLQPPPPTP